MRSGIQEAEEFHSSGIIRAVPPLFEEEFLSIRRWLVAGFALVTFTPGATAQREPVLKQINEPHAYYFREISLPQLRTGPGSMAWSPDSRSLVYSMAGSLWLQG